MFEGLYEVTAKTSCCGIKGKLLLECISDLKTANHLDIIRVLVSWECTNARQKILFISDPIEISRNCVNILKVLFNFFDMF